MMKKKSIRRVAILGACVLAVGSLAACGSESGSIQMVGSTSMEKYANAKVKEAQAEWLQSRPQVNTGSYSSMSREQIMAIADRDERMKAIAQNQHLF